MTEIDERFVILRRRFVDRCAQDLDMLRGHASADLDQLNEVVHRLSGTAGMFGFVKLGAAAQRVEDLLRDAPGELLEPAINSLVDELATVQTA